MRPCISQVSWSIRSFDHVQILPERLESEFSVDDHAVESTGADPAIWRSLWLSGRTGKDAMRPWGARIVAASVISAGQQAIWAVTP